jgi:hypothetical protein
VPPGLYSSCDFQRTAGSCRWALPVSASPGPFFLTRICLFRTVARAFAFPYDRVVMSKAYGLYLGCSRAPIKRRIRSWIQPSHRRRGVEPNGSMNGSVPLWKRRGVACLAPDREGHAGLNGCVPWGHTGPQTRECSVQVTMRIRRRSLHTMRAFEQLSSYRPPQLEHAAAIGALANGLARHAVHVTLHPAHALSWHCLLRDRAFKALGTPRHE